MLSHTASRADLSLSFAPQALRLLTGARYPGCMWKGFEMGTFEDVKNDGTISRLENENEQLRAALKRIKILARRNKVDPDVIYEIASVALDDK
jgi:hypothetical protein